MSVPPGAAHGFVYVAVIAASLFADSPRAGSPAFARADSQFEAVLQLDRNSMWTKQGSTRNTEALEREKSGLLAGESDDIRGVEDKVTDDHPSGERASTRPQGLTWLRRGVDQEAPALSALAGPWASADGHGALLENRAYEDQSPGRGTPLPQRAPRGSLEAPCLHTPNGPLDVRCFGAAGNGTTDDTSAFNAAIAASGNLVSGNPQTVYCPAGTYKVTTVLIAKGGVLLSGGKDCILKGSTPVPVLEIKPATTQTLQHVTVTGIAINCNSVATNGIHVYDATVVKIDDVDISGGCTSDGVLHEMGVTDYYTKVRSRGNGRDGFRITIATKGGSPFASNEVVMDKCQAQSNKGNGFSLLGGIGNVVTYSDSSGNDGHGVYIFDGVSHQVIHDWLETNKISGITVDNRSPGQINNHLIQGNSIQADTNNGDVNILSGVGTILSANDITGALKINANASKTGVWQQARIYRGLTDNGSGSYRLSETGAYWKSGTATRLGLAIGAGAAFTSDSFISFPCKHVIGAGPGSSSCLDVDSGASINVARFAAPVNGYIDFTDSVATLRFQLLSHQPNIGTLGNYPLVFKTNSVQAAALPVDGGIQLSGTTQPRCDPAHAGVFWYSGHKAGIKDSAAVCAADASNTYSWRTLY